MKNIYLLLIALISISLNAQNSYQDGFNSGYSAGYCYGQASCLSPLPPLAGLAPINPVGQSDYQTGYNYGFTEGQRNQTSNTPTNRNGGAYGQLKRTEPDRTQEYIANGINRLMQEQKDRQEVKRESEINQDEIKNNYIAVTQDISSKIDKTFTAFKMVKDFLDAKNVGIDKQKKALEKHSDSLNQIIAFYNDNRNNLDQSKTDLIYRKINDLNEEWSFSLNYGEIKSLMDEISK